MEQATYSASNLCKSQIIALGRQLENNYRQITFDCSDFTETITSIMLMHQRNGDVAPYIVNSSTGNSVTWTVTATDTSFYGYGKGELRIYFANGMAKSVVFPTLVIKSITADAVIPAELQSWYDQMIAYIDAHNAPVTSVNGNIGDVIVTGTYICTYGTTTSAEIEDALNDGMLPCVGHNGFIYTLRYWDGSVFGFVCNYETEESTIYCQSDVWTLGATNTFLTSAPVTSVNGQTGAVSLSIPTNTSDLVNDSGFITSAVTSFNGSTGAVTYTAPVASVDGKTGTVAVLPTGGTTGQVLAKKTGTNYDVEWQTVSGGGAVSSVNGKTGAVTVDEVYWCTYGTTTSAEIETAITAGYLPCVENGGYTYTLRYRNSATNHRFVCNYGCKERTIVCKSGVWADGGTLTFLTSAPVTSVNGQTGAVTTPNTTYSMSIANNAITLTPSTGAAQTVTPADATTTVAGYMSATDKLHLDAVYADYTSAINALGVS